MRRLPVSAAWRHVGAQVGFEALFIHADGDGYRFEGHSTAVEEGVAWGVRYSIELDSAWITRRAHVVGLSEAGVNEVRLEADGAHGWLVDGVQAPELTGCPDVDLEASAATNALPVLRLALEVGARADAPAAYVRAPNLRVERLEQSYTRLPDDGTRQRYDYVSPAFDFSAELVYDELGLVIDYPGIAERAWA